MEGSDIRGPHPKRGIRVPERSLQAYYPELARIGAEMRIEAGGILSDAQSDEALVKAADDNLYKAKEGGRNRVVASTAEEAAAGATSHFS
jgi:GGDEF domain-containing protein